MDGEVEIFFSFQQPQGGKKNKEKGKKGNRKKNRRVISRMVEESEFRQ